MKKITSLQVALLPTADLVIGETTYKLCLDMNALAKANEVLKKDLTNSLNWKKLAMEELTVIAWAALDRFHPEVDLRTVRQWLGAVQQVDLWSLLIEACWPGFWERVEEEQKKLRMAEVQKARATGGDEPNLPAEAK